MAGVLIACAGDRSEPTLPEPTTPATPATPAAPVVPATPPVDSTPLERDTMALPAAVASITVLPSLGGGFTNATSIADNGMVAGYSARSDGTNRAFAWTATGGIRDLGVLPGDAYAAANAVNARGEVVGFSGTQTPQGIAAHAFIWSATAGIRAITAPGSQSTALRINGRGEVVGSVSVTAGGPTRPFVWSESGGLQEIELPAGAVSGTAWAINDSGTVVGHVMMTTGSAVFVPFVWSRAQGMKLLPTLGGTWAIASAINEAGLIAGTSALPGDSSMHAIAWKQGVLRDVGSLGGYATFVRTISPDGDVFGESDPIGAKFKQHGFVARSRGMQDLHVRAGLSTVFGVNRQLQVVGDSLLVQLRREQ